MNTPAILRICIPRRLSGAIVATAMMAATPALADILVDNFDGYTTKPVVSSTFGNAVWHGDPGAAADDGLALGYRTANPPGGFSAPIFFSSKSTTVTANGTGKAFKINDGTGAAINAATNTVTPAIARLQSIVVGLARPSGGTTNLTIDRYLRFTSWRTINTASVFPGARALVTVNNPIVNSFSYPNQSFGPYANISETIPTGFAPTTTPTVYLIDMTSASQFRMNESYYQGAYLNNAVTGSIRPTTATLNNINGFSIGWWRFDSASTSVLGNLDLFVDDIMFIASVPAINAVGSTVTTSLDEVGGNSTSNVPVSLSAMPSHNVTLFPSSSNTATITVPATPLVFTPANWNVPQFVTVTAVDDTVHAPTRPASLQFARVTNDLYYMDAAKTPMPSVPFEISDNGLPVAVSTVNMD